MGIFSLAETFKNQECGFDFNDATIPLSSKTIGHHVNQLAAVYEHFNFTPKVAPGHPEDAFVLPETVIRKGDFEASVVSRLICQILS